MPRHLLTQPRAKALAPTITAILAGTISSAGTAIASPDPALQPTPTATPALLPIAAPNAIPLARFAAALEGDPTPIPLALADRELRLVPETARPVPAVGGRVLRGSIEGERGRFVLAEVDGALAGAVWLDNTAYDIRPADGPGRYRAVEIDPASLAPCGTNANGHEEIDRDPEPIANPRADDASPRPRFALRRARSDAPDQTLRVLIAYNHAAENALGGPAGAAANAAALIAAANDAYDNSAMTLGDLGAIQCRLELAAVITVDSGPAATGQALINRLRSPSDDFMDEVHPVRDAAAADAVALIADASNTLGVCGIARLGYPQAGTQSPGSFSVTAWNCALGGMTFAHEVGHNQGADHDPANAGNGARPYATGHRWTETQTDGPNDEPTETLRRSIMAYFPGLRAPHFSNPDVSQGGEPTGTPTSDNARRIGETFPDFANERRGAGIPITDCDADGTLDPVQIDADLTADSNFSGVLDSCELAQGLLDDCNADGVADIAQATPRFERTPLYINLTGEGPHPTTIDDAPLAAGDITLHLWAQAKLESPDAWIEISINGIDFGRFWENDGVDCDRDINAARITLPAAAWNALGPTVTVEARKSEGFAGNCTGVAPFNRVYVAATGNENNPAFDADANGLLDDCERCNDADRAPPFGLLDLDDVAAFVAAFSTADPAADLTGDTALDLDDIVAFLNSFAAGCP